MTACNLCLGSGISGTGTSATLCPTCGGDGLRREWCQACRGQGAVLGYRRPYFGLGHPVRAAVPCRACGGRGYAERPALELLEGAEPDPMGGGLHRG